ncbi:MAG: nicotinate-nucleotide--dimethylbenzimidazole phosphoribosyltransferase [Eubacteriales bacterium]|nr:nicotinate-nucleotide--dimethylbenzimidazole phosphoribosyltransferase [Eubacteriales bacterium]
MTLEEAILQIRPLNREVMEITSHRWDSIAKPLHSLGKLEQITIQMAGITGEPDFPFEKRALVAFCADNGVVEEGVTQTGQEVTAIVAENFLKGDTSVCAMCRQAGVDLIPLDMGMVTDTKVRKDFKVAYGTKNMLKEPAMSREEAVKGIEGGIAVAEELKSHGYQLLAVGEMGIGNTTTSSAVASVLLKQDPAVMTGRGAGLSSQGLTRKIQVITESIAKHQPNPEDPVDVLAKVGGFDIAGMVGLYIGAAALHLPVIMDGFISCVAGLTAVKICPQVSDYLIASHVSKEPAAHWILEAMNKEAVLHADMCLGEGTGAVSLIPFLEMGAAVYHSMSTFEDIHVDQYEEFS